MVDLLVYWVLVPGLVLAVAWGWGLLIFLGREAAEWRSSMAVLSPAVGMAALCVVGGLMLSAEATAPLFAPMAGLVAVGGWTAGVFAIRHGWLSLPRDWRPGLGVGLIAYVCLGAVVLLSGEATFAGHVKLDDTATWFAFIDHLPEYGRNVDSLAISTYEATLSLNLADGYPIGALVPNVIASTLTGADPAWTFQPLLALWGGLLAVVVRYMVRGFQFRPVVSTITAVVASQAALLYGYHHWGGVKEVAGATVIALVCALILQLDRDGDSDGRWRLGAGAVLASAAVIAVFGAAGGLWLLPAAVLLVVSTARKIGWPRVLRLLGGFAVLAVALITALGWELLPPMARPLDDPEAFGNLAGALNPLQILGVWPASPDFRFDPTLPGVAWTLIAMTAVLYCLAIWHFLAPGRHAALVFILGVPLVSLTIALVGSPWVGGKALAIASPAALTGALLGGFVLHAKYRWAGSIALVAVIAGVAWSNILAVDGASLAPRDQYLEMEEINNKFAGAGPTFVAFHDPYANRHFLRSLDAESASELRRRVLKLDDGTIAATGTDVLPSELTEGALDSYNVIVLRKSDPAPEGFRRAYEGAHFTVWTRVEPPGSGPP